MKKMLLLLAPAVSLLTCCQSNEVMESKNVAQAEIHQGYFITYDEENNTTEVNAEFRVAGSNGTTLVLSEPSDARCNGEEMQLETYILGGAHYVLGKSGLQQNLELEFVDHDKKSFKNRFAVEPTSFDGHLSHLPLKENTQIRYKGRPPGDGETLLLELDGDSTHVSVDAERGETHFSLTPDNLNEFRAGEKVSLQIIRQKNGTLQQTESRGGNYSIRCTSKRMHVTTF